MSDFQLIQKMWNIKALKKSIATEGILQPVVVELREHEK